MCFLAKMYAPLTGLNRRFVHACAAGILSLGCAEPASALEWRFNGDAKIAEEYNTNIFLNAPAPKDGAWGQGFDTMGQFGVSDLNWHSRLVGRFNNRWYLPNSSLDYQNQLFNWNADYALERSRFGLDAEYNLDTTLTQAADVASDLGFVFARIPKTTRVLAPNWHYDLSEKTELGLNYSYQDTEYDSKKNLNRFPNSRAHTGSLELSHTWNERLRLFGNATYTDYALTSQDNELVFPNRFFDSITLVPGSTTSIRTTTGMAGFDYALSETLQVSLAGGLQYNQTATPKQFVRSYAQFPDGNILLLANRENAASSANSLGEVFSAKIDQRFENSNINLSISRSISPNITGQLFTYETYGVSGQYRFSPLLSGSLSATYSEQTSPAQQNQAAQTLQRLSLQSSLNYQWSEHWVLSGNYQYSQIEYSQRTETPNNHALYLNLQYLFDQRF